jgi:hypothetical protein
MNAPFFHAALKTLGGEILALDQRIIPNPAVP